MPVSRIAVCVFAVVAVAAAVPTARAIVIYNPPVGAGMPTAAQNTSAPADDEGWQFVGQWNAGGGVAISPHYMLSAQHLGITPGNTFKLNGTTYTTDNTYSDPIAGSDLVLYKLAAGESFPAYAPLYASANEVGQTASMIGFGGPAGAALSTGGVDNGWYATGSTSSRSWGQNILNGDVIDAANGFHLLTFSFDSQNPIANEDIYSGGDSGGGLFINNAGTWELAGIAWAVDGPFYQSNVDDPAANPPINGLIYNARNLYLKDANGNYIPAATAYGGSPPYPQTGYASRISSYFDDINSVIASDVPEPTTLLLLTAASPLLLLRRRTAYRA